MKHKIGVLVRDFGPSQLTYEMISSANKLMVERSDTDIIGFFENSAKHSFGLNFSSMYLDEAWSYTGTLIATSLSTAVKLIKLPSAQRKLFYVYDLEWLRIYDKNFSVLAKLYRHKEIELVARSATHAKLLSNCWNIQNIKVIESFDIEKFLWLY